MAYVLYHPLGDQELGELGQAPGGERQTVVHGTGQGNPFYLSSLPQGERGRAATRITRVQRFEAVVVEVIDDRPHPVRAGKGDLRDLAYVHALSRQQHHLRPPPGHHRPRGAAHDAQQPVAFFVRQLAYPQAFSHPTSWPRRYRTRPACQCGYLSVVDPNDANVG
jgi:hypothetical protein